MSSSTAAPRTIPSPLAGPLPFLAALALCAWALGTVVAAVHEPQSVIPHREHVGWGLGGAALGALLCLVFAHPSRVLGFVPVGSFLWVVLLPIEGPYPWCRTLAFLAGMAMAFILLPLALTAWRRLGMTGKYRLRLKQSDLFITLVLLAVLAGGMYLHDVVGITPRTHFWAWWGAQAVGMVAALVVFRRGTMEWLAATLMMPMYRLRTMGPGQHQIPWEGPLLFVANHAAWIDPFWIGKIIPRSFTPMMTSVFYDLPGVHFVMKYMLHVIRVAYQPGRKEAPELNQAIAELDQGEAVLIFPEGGLRRKEELPLKLFGQGVWRILKERPDTPVVCCWIEGNWGSYFSAQNGEPTKNKKFDWFRPITVVIGSPTPVPPEILATQQATRRYLMDRVLEMRKFIPGMEHAPKAGTSDPAAVAKEEVEA